MQRSHLVIGALVILVVVTAVTFARQPMFWYRYFAIGPDIWTAQPIVFRPREVVKGSDGTELPFVDGDNWAITPRAISAAINHSELRNTDALIVLQGGRVEVERYWGTATRDSVYNGSAISAVAAAILTGIAIDDGHIKSVDDAIGEYLDAWKDDPRGEITIRQALQMTSGLKPIAYRGWPWSKGSAYLFGAQFDTSLLSAERLRDPGSQWEYNPEDINLVGLVLEQATGKRYAEYLSEKLWQPLGQTHGLVYVDRKDGLSMQSCCLMSRPMDWAKIGQLLLDEGRFNGEQIVSAAWVREMITPSAGSKSFGFQVWLGDTYVDYTGATVFDPNRLKVPAAEPFSANEMIVFHSPGLQRIWVFPEYELVIVRAAAEASENWDETYLPNLIIGGLTSNRAPPAALPEETPSPVSEPDLAEPVEDIPADGLDALVPQEN